ncbi:MAG: hypothetical protein K2N56_08375, partial [Oscillospiraceae bacterium]|nr:hypothetical protein [Oscillospiraceae bacterium]
MANQNNVPGFSGEAAEALGSAITIAGQMGHTYIGSEHLLCALAKNSESAAGVLLARQQVRFRDLILHLKDRAGIAQSVELNEKDFSPRLKKLLLNARSIAAAKNDGYVGTEHILLALLTDRDCTAYSMLAELGGETVTRLYGNVSARSYEPPRFDSAERKPEPKSAKKTENPRCEFPVLSRYGRELTALARKGARDPVIG